MFKHWYWILPVVLVGALFAVLLILVSDRPDGTVTDYNDGFATSKQDDCRQGSQYACQWLDQAHISR
jgi:hypothetical protein